MSEEKKRCRGCGCCGCGGPKKDGANLDAAGLDRLFRGYPDGAAGGEAAPKRRGRPLAEPEEGAEA